MAKTPSRIGLPSRASIIAEKEFTPPVPRRRGAPALAAALTGSPRSGLPSTYRIITTNEVDAYEAPLRPAEAQVFGLNRLKAPGDEFVGSARKAAKLVIGNGPVQTFPNVTAILTALPATDPKISDGPKSGRVQEEQRNVRVTAFLYAASREGDNDFHLIVGDDPGGSKVRMMTMEVSGLPPSGSRSFAKLKRARDAFKGFFGADLPGLGYDFYDPPIKIDVEGSLFYDATHAHGTPPGPAKLRPRMPRIWEVHPVSSIRFEP